MDAGTFHPISKPWGHTYRLPMPSGCEVYVAYIRAGGESSFHKHLQANNVFFVVSGALEIRQQIGGFIRLKAGDVLPVETNNWHSFRAMEDSVVVEAYAAVDIYREKNIS